MTLSIYFMNDRKQACIGYSTSEHDVTHYRVEDGLLYISTEGTCIKKLHIYLVRNIHHLELVEK